MYIYACYTRHVTAAVGAAAGKCLGSASRFFFILLTVPGGSVGAPEGTGAGTAAELWDAAAAAAAAAAGVPDALPQAEEVAVAVKA